MPKIKNKNIFFFLVFLTFFSLVLRFYGLNWGAPFYFHPDERNIASSVTQLRFPDQLNPHFFAYGSLPIYTIYFTGVLANLLNNSARIFQIDFSQAILISRFYSAFFSTLLVPVLFLIGKKLYGERTGVLASVLAATSVGLIQFAHFGTFEMWLTFFTVILFWLCLIAFEKKSSLTIILLGIVFGILFATKVSHLALFPLAALAVLVKEIHHSKGRRITYRIARTLRSLLLFTLFSAAAYVLTNPYVFLATEDFLGSMRYESGVALGTTKVFYTGEFYNTLPVVFQFLHVYPFLLNPPVTVLFIPSFFYLLFLTIKKRSLELFLLTAFFLLLFFSQAFLFVKWTRYMVPTLPFIYLVIALAAERYFSSRKKEILHDAFSALVLAISSIFAVSYFISAFVMPDSRLEALSFARKNIPSASKIMSEVYDLGITPFNDHFLRIELFNFYDLDQQFGGTELDSLKARLANTDYIILPSPRILKSRTLNKNKFPTGYLVYKALQENKLGYYKIYQSSCDLFCRITYLGDPIYSYEGTANVFDRPDVIIYKRLP